ncbi:hypothetical protein [Paenibacillus sp. J23TS9]|uniref:hypothetical protein n=1 Tax=Paenibacillus sp. J23TS9 TaxID=2807193 RepID=UPI001BCEA833|nr:hypothetical protein [Paenibacillus sp. J23TS9]
MIKYPVRHNLSDVIHRNEQPLYLRTHQPFHFDRKRRCNQFLRIDRPIADIFRTFYILAISIQYIFGGEGRLDAKRKHVPGVLDSRHFLGMNGDALRLACSIREISDGVFIGLDGSLCSADSFLASDRFCRFPVSMSRPPRMP